MVFATLSFPGVKLPRISLSCPPLVSLGRGDPVLCQYSALGPVANTDTKLLIYGLFQRDLYLWLDTRPPLPVGGEAGFGMALALALPLVVTVLRLRFDFFGAW